MANVLYPKFLEQILQAGINLSSVTVKAMLIDSGAYTYSATHEFLSDVASGARIASSNALTGKSFTNGVFDATDTVFPTASGVSCEAIILYVDTGTPSTSRLIAFLDTQSGLPITPNGQDINYVFDNGANKIFAL